MPSDGPPDALYHRLGDPCPHDDCDQRFLGEHGKQSHLDRQHDERGRYRVEPSKTSLGPGPKLLLAEIDVTAVVVSQR